MYCMSTIALQRIWQCSDQWSTGLHRLKADFQCCVFHPIFLHLRLRTGVTHAETDELNPVQLFTCVKHLRNVSPNQKVDWDHVKIAMTAILILLFILRREFYALLEINFTCVFPDTFTYTEKNAWLEISLKYIQCFRYTGCIKKKRPS
jgi:hypothetical protein